MKFWGGYLLVCSIIAQNWFSRDFTYGKRHFQGESGKTWADRSIAWESELYYHPLLSRLAE